MPTTLARFFLAGKHAAPEGWDRRIPRFAKDAKHGAPFFRWSTMETWATRLRSGLPQPDKASRALLGPSGSRTRTRTSQETEKSLASSSILKTSKTLTTMHSSLSMVASAIILLLI
jgi:hypothetical protein